MGAVESFAWAGKTGQGQHQRGSRDRNKTATSDGFRSHRAECKSFLGTDRAAEGFERHDERVSGCGPQG